MPSNGATITKLILTYINAATIGEVEEFRKEANHYFKKINNEAIEEAKKEGIALRIKVQAGMKLKL